MNKARRQKLEDVVSSLMGALSALEDITNEEQESMDNMPENLQYSERYDNMQECIDCLDNVKDDLENVIDDINDIISM